MPDNRYYSDTAFTRGEKVLLKGEELHHLLRVMRVKIGESVELVNGRGQLAEATLHTLNSECAELRLDSLSAPPAKREKELILAQAIPRLNRLEFLLEKGTELGASQFWLFPSERSEKEGFSPNQERRMQQIVISAMKQCGRLFLPKIHLKPPLSKWAPPEGTLFYGDTRQEAPSLLSCLEKNPLHSEPILFFIGPEGGFHPKEFIFLEEKFGARGVKLHENTLRVDTAGLLSVGLLSHFLSFRHLS